MGLEQVAYLVRTGQTYPATGPCAFGHPATPLLLVPLGPRIQFPLPLDPSSPQIPKLQALRVDPSPLTLTPPSPPCHSLKQSLVHQEGGSATS